MTSSEKFKAIKNEAKKTIAQIKQLEEGNGSFESPVNTDMVKTTKAMFFENVLEILRTKE